MKKLKIIFSWLFADLLYNLYVLAERKYCKSVASYFEFAIFKNGVEQAGTRFVTSYPAVGSSDNQTQLIGNCHVSITAGDIITVRNVANNALQLSALSATGSPNTASITIEKVGDI